jgi:hypothetical protein
LCFLKIDFPAVTICGSGRIDSNLEAGLFNSFTTFLKDNGGLQAFEEFKKTKIVQKVIIVLLF